MKKNWMLFLFFAAFAALTFSGCSDDDNSDVPENTHLVSKEVQAAFNAISASQRRGMGAER